MNEKLEHLTEKSLAEMADGLLKELDHLEEVERNLVPTKSEHIVRVNGQTFEFPSDDAMWKFIFKVNNL